MLPHAAHLTRMSPRRRRLGTMLADCLRKQAELRRGQAASRLIKAKAPAGALGLKPLMKNTYVSRGFFSGASLVT